MYYLRAVKLQTSKRKTQIISYFTNDEVAEYVASQQTGYEDNSGIVDLIEVDESTSIEEYNAAMTETQKLKAQEEWSTFYNSLTEKQQAMLTEQMNSSTTATL